MFVSSASYFIGTLYFEISMLLFAACSAHCGSCATNGAGKCDVGQCDAGYGPDATDVCLACDPNCNLCATAGAGKCESNACKAHYVYIGASQTCEGKT